MKRPPPPKSLPPGYPNGRLRIATSQQACDLGGISTRCYRRYECRVSRGYTHTHHSSPPVQEKDINPICANVEARDNPLWQGRGYHGSRGQAAGDDFFGQKCGWEYGPTVTNQFLVVVVGRDTDVLAAHIGSSGKNTCRV